MKRLLIKLYEDDYASYYIDLQRHQSGLSMSQPQWAPIQRERKSLEGHTVQFSFCAAEIQMCVYVREKVNT